jgi:carbon storage regulator
MLILTRMPGETIIIGDDIVITYIRRNGNQAILGFDAPKEINIRRSELPEYKRPDKK